MIGVWLALLAGLSIGAAIFSIAYPIDHIGLDFNAFWCAAKTLQMHGNPYLNQPLHACEAMNVPAFFAANPNVTVPAPLPPYALALLAPLALVPFAYARALWWLVLLAATLAAGFGIASVARVPRSLGIASSFLAILGPAVFPGALAPIPVALTIFATHAVQRAAWNRAAILLGCAMIEPHMVLPACLCVFLFIPQLRLRLMAVASVLGALTLAAVGPSVALAYFTQILPAHALAEVNNLAQYSLTAALYHLGVAPGAAVRAGSIQYAVFALGGAAIARRLQRGDEDASWLVLIPAGFAVIGGAFIHLDQVAMIVPVGVMLYRRIPAPGLLAILIFLAIPGEIIINWLPFALPGAFVCAVLVARSGGRVVIVASLAVLGVAAGLLALLVGGPHVAAPMMRIAEPAANASASVSWGAFNAYASIRPRIWWTEKLLTMVPLVALLAWVLRHALRATSECHANGEEVRLPGSSAVIQTV